jgi:hypothetical protein
MDAQELRNLQEAYMEVVENQQLDEGYKIRNAAKISDQHRRLKSKSDLAQRSRASEMTDKLVRSDAANSQMRDREEKFNKTRENKRSKLVSDNNAKKRAFGNRLMRSDGQGIRDSYDFYDIILSHLLDEGYADTQEAAEAIMVNMSEDWRNVILDALDEGYKPLPTDRIKNKARKLAKDTLSDVGTTFNPFKSSDEKEKAKDNMTKRQKRVDKMVDVLKKTK